MHFKNLLSLVDSYFQYQDTDDLIHSDHAIKSIIKSTIDSCRLFRISLKDIQDHIALEINDSMPVYYSDIFTWLQDYTWDFSNTMGELQLQISKDLNIYKATQAVYCYTLEQDINTILSHIFSNETNSPTL